MTPNYAKILLRVQAMAPHNTAKQRRLITRWAGVLRANDPQQAAALLSMRLVGSSNESRLRGR